MVKALVVLTNEGKMMAKMVLGFRSVKGAENRQTSECVIGESFINDRSVIVDAPNSIDCDGVDHDENQDQLSLCRTSIYHPVVCQKT